MKVQADRQFLRGELAAGGGLIEAGIQPSPAKDEIVDANVDFGRVQIAARVAGRADDAPPVGIAPRYGSGVG